MFPRRWFQENFGTSSVYFLGHFKQTCPHSVKQVKKKGGGIPEARQFFFQINTVIESKLIPKTGANGPIHIIQKPTDWPEKKRLGGDGIEVC